MVGTQILKQNKTVLQYNLVVSKVKTINQSYWPFGTQILKKKKKNNITD